ncbi:hypothetical protein PISL3812_04875 [Talaromyces islandicus]|uniref:GPI anchored cell wall protein n=1 Tax=Talaromyces islandicus TaxID=28573 RepID=A0A0U1LWS1_TALIS|nr:hypothetical protein PISL3812_04875 [Talaromyces islandicus]
MAPHYLLLGALMAANAISAATTLSTTAAAPATTTTASGLTTEIQLYEIGETQSVPKFTGLAGSIVAANAVATTIAIDCSGDTDKCGRVSWPITAVQGPSTRGGSFVVKTETGGIEATVTFENDCKITGTGTTKSATCTKTMVLNGEAAGQKVSSTISSTTTASNSDITLQPLRITAGVDILNSPQGTTTPGAAPPAVTGHMGLAFVAAAAAFL